MTAQDTRTYPDEARRGQREAVRESKNESVHEIRRDIDRTRSELDRTFDRLEQALSPSRLIDRGIVWAEQNFTRKSSRPDHPGSQSDAGLGSRCSRLAADNPIPTALIMAGVAWLIIDSLLDRSDRGRRTQLPKDRSMVPPDVYAESSRPHRPTSRQTEAARPSHLSAAGPVTGERPTPQRAGWAAGTEDGRH